MVGARLGQWIGMMLLLGVTMYFSAPITDWIIEFFSINDIERNRNQIGSAVWFILLLLIGFWWYWNFEKR